MTTYTAMEAHLARWTREVADVRIHGTTGERPLDRFTRDEAAACSRWRGVRRFVRSAS